MPRTKKQPDKRTELARFVEVNKIEALIIAAGIILLLFLIYTIQIVISPFIVLGAILFLLYPLRSHVVARNIMWLAGVLFLFWFLYSIVGILAPFVVSLLLAYILHPLITKAETWGIPRWASSLFTIFCGIAVITVVALLVLPIAFRQFTGILEAVSTIANDFTNWIVSDRAVASLHQYGISTQQVRDMLTNTFAPRLEIIMKGLLEVAFGLVSSLS